MSKVICDVCGTTYPETAAQCPICGSAKTTTAQTAAGVSHNKGDDYAYVKGGRFSKANVRKHSQGGKELKRRPVGEHAPRTNVMNIILIIIVILLILAIVAVLGYMGYRMLFNNNVYDNQIPNDPGINGPQDPVTPCEKVTLSKSSIELAKAGDAQLLSCTVSPANTTEKLTYSSSDPTVATVSESGLVTAVGGGHAVITVTCGQQTATCEVICNFGSATEPTEPSEPTEPTVTVPAGYELTLKIYEFTMSAQYPNPVSLYVSNSSVAATDITWESSNPDVATVSEKGVVSAVGKGSATITATIGDQKKTCKVIVSFNPEPPKTYTYKISNTDVTLKVGESFNLFLSDSEGINVDVEWVASVDGYVTITGRNIKGIQATSDVAGKCITVSATIDGETYSCVIRIVESSTT